MIMALGLVVGLAVPPLAEVIARAIAPLMAAVLFLTVLRTDSRIVLRYLCRPRLPLLGLAAIFAAVPALTAVAVALLPIDDGLARSLLLNSATPPILGSPAVALLLAFDFELALVCMVTGTLMAPLTLAAASWLALSAESPIDFVAVLVRVALLTAAPTLAGVAMQRWIGWHRVTTAGRPLQHLIVAGLAILGVGLMDGANQALARDPVSVIWVTLAALAFNLGHQFVVHRLLTWAGIDQAGVIAIMCGCRNLGMTFAGVGGAAGEVFAVYVAVGQVPVYLSPMMWRWLTHRRHPSRPEAPD